MTSIKIANISDVISVVDYIFTHYATSLTSYCNQGQQFNNEEMHKFFQCRSIFIMFSPSKALQSTKIVEIINTLLEKIL